MNIKHHLHLLFFVLLGYLAKANLNMQLHAGIFNRYDSVAAKEYGDHEKRSQQAVFSSNLPEDKNPRIKVRFCAASFISIAPTVTPGLPDSNFSTIAYLLIGKTAYLPPFYYIFLFRLTPF